MFKPHAQNALQKIEKCSNHMLKNVQRGCFQQSHIEPLNGQI